ncbi:hypothetical protein DSECCO2_422620 [anaerobic digester metagenome]
MKVIKITTDDVISVVDIQEPTLRGMQEQVGGSIEVVRPYGLYELNVPGSESLIMICNEDGKNLELDENFVASDLYDPVCGDDIVGDILIMAEGFVNGEPDIVGLTDEQVQALYGELLNEYDYCIKYISNRKCRVCGCTEDNACPGGCYWVEEDLCSECVGKEIEVEIETKEETK